MRDKLHQQILCVELRWPVDGRTSRDMPTPVTVDIHTAGGKARLVRTRPRTFYGDLARRRAST